MYTEIDRPVASGYLMLLVLLGLQISLIFGVFYGATHDWSWQSMVAVILANIMVLICWAGFFMVHPNQSRVMQLFGSYAGSCSEPGLRWANPFYTKKAISLRVRNFESGKLKVNDKAGNPIEIAAVVVWRVIDTAEAVFQVDDFEGFVSIQSEAAIRNLATSYSYDQNEHEQDISLRSHTQEIALQMRKEIQLRLDKAGVNVIEARISHLAYASEIAGAMLRRQQATAVIAARSKIVDNAVSMVEMALNKLSDKKIVELDAERKASMVSNLLVVLCSDHDAHPVVNTGSLYS